ncbi:hypothetical protein [Sphingomonas bacterium]|uniref:hypothetical protein n=1 Tax=Sphingomonas bacterium TaxID=1895847 RepID=UPI0015770F82|nr:hypothetical protein [Sphingomonas bacterium]
MADVDGTWNCTVKSPLGDQRLTMTIATSGTSFSGQAGGAMGSMPIEGSVAGDVLKWKLSITVPMPMTLDCEATVSGDSLAGEVGAGGFGSFALSGTRG